MRQQRLRVGLTKRIPGTLGRLKRRLRYGAPLRKERNQLVGSHAAKIRIALHETHFARLKAHRIELRQNLQQLQLVVQIVLEPQNDLGEFRRPPQGRVARSKVVEQLDRIARPARSQILPAHAAELIERCTGRYRALVQYVAPWQVRADNPSLCEEINHRVAIGDVKGGGLLPTHLERAFMATLNFHPGGYRDVHDRRDRRFSPSIGPLPPKADLSRFCGVAYQQYRTQSCSANALASALTLDANQRDVPLARPSRLFMYYNARAQTNSQATDSGTTIRNAIKAYAREGACAERQWPFRKRDITKCPTKACYRDAGALPIQYHRIPQHVDDLRAALAEGHAFIFGIQAYGEPFTAAAKTGTLRLPKKSDTLYGGHALIAVGYDSAKNRFLARNSLGRDYARDGFFWIPDAYFTDAELTYDFWVVGGAGDGGNTG
jgi:hypothetical protein